MAHTPRIGLVSYTNLTSGIGVFAAELIRYLGIDSVLSVKNRVKGQEEWIERQMNGDSPLTKERVNAYLDKYKPDVVLFFETPFGSGLQWCRTRRNDFKVVAIPMQETMGAKDFSWCDALFCPCQLALDKAQRQAVKRAYGLFLPIGLEMFPYRQRTGHIFVHNVGYGWRADRRQTKRVVEAFVKLEDPEARLIINAQERFPEGCIAKDERIDYRLRSYEKPADIFVDGDIAILPVAYGGYERMIPESMASGMPTLTVDADPMSMFQHDPDFLMRPSRSRCVTSPFFYKVIFNEVSVGALHKKMEWLLGIDTAAYGQKAYRQAKAQSWESEQIDYRKVWMDTLCDVAS